MYANGVDMHWLKPNIHANWADSELSLSFIIIYCFNVQLRKRSRKELRERINCVSSNSCSMPNAQGPKSIKYFWFSCINMSHSKQKRKVIRSAWVSGFWVFINIYWMQNQTMITLNYNLDTYSILGCQIGCDGIISIDNNKRWNDGADLIKTNF